MSKTREDNESEVLECVRDDVEEEIKPPRMYKVILWNDPITTMDFVMRVLFHVFNMTPQTAIKVMLAAHTTGKAVAGVFPRSIAETKIQLVDQMRSAEGFPLRTTMEED